ncbi:MAG: hypothetical protein ACKV0T_03015 [Planctomycetales bacterium]
MSSPVLLLVFDAALAAIAWLLADQGRMTPAWSILGALAVLGIWQLVLFSSTRQATVAFRVESFIRSTHYIQGILQGTIYVYLSLYWGDIGTYLPLLVAQALVGYLVDMQLCWSRGRPVRLGFAIIPVILSTNLFLWFKEDYFYYQLLMVASAFLAKELVTWNYGGRRRHIFNPSALPLSVVSLIILATGQVGLTRGVDLVGAFELPPNFYEVIFLLGLVTQVLFLTTPVSLGAVLALYLWFLAGEARYGEPLSATPVQIQVFLGLTFLVTDPATSPKSSLGKFLFGLAYGTGVFATYVLLRTQLLPAYFDKLLTVPVVNLMVPLFDRVSTWIESYFTDLLKRIPLAWTRYGWWLAYIGLFALVVPTLKVAKTRELMVLPPPVTRVSGDLRRLVSNHIYCRSVFPEAFKPFGLRYEFSHLSAIRKVYEEGPAGAPPRPESVTIGQ